MMYFNMHMCLSKGYVIKYMKIGLPQCIADWGTFVPQWYSVENQKVGNAKVNLGSRRFAADM